MIQSLSDPAYRDLHLLGVAALKQAGELPWYDAHFLRNFEAAKIYLAEASPDLHDAFVEGFGDLQDAALDHPVDCGDLFDEHIRADIAAAVKTIPDASLEQHEAEHFGRSIVHDHEFFSNLQRALLPRVSELAGRPLTAGYNFLSLYSGSGVCAPHMDEPISMFTLDYCIDTNVDWPIYFGQGMGWPDTAFMQDALTKDLREHPDLSYQSHVIAPGEAILFQGSSHVHYRDPIPLGGYAHMVFLHYHPAGLEKLVRPPMWHEHFAMPVLKPMCDLFDNLYPPIPSSDGDMA